MRLFFLGRFVHEGETLLQGEKMNNTFKLETKSAVSSNVN